MGLDPASTASGQHNEYLQRAYALANPEAAQTLYNEWATSYDKDLNASDYASPQRAVETVVANIANHAGSLTILDAGCGTGLVGQCLENSVVKNEFVVDGLDITQGMLSVARQKGVYRNLDVADLSKPLETKGDSYDVVLCVGTLTKGHVGPEVFGEFVRVAKKGGLIVATVHGEVWETGGYEREVNILDTSKQVQCISTNDFGILQDTTEGGKMVVLKKL